MIGWRVDEWCDTALSTALEPVAGDVTGSLAAADRIGPFLGAPGSSAWDALSVLATLGAVDLGTARALEPHLDALAILGQAGRPDLSALAVDRASRWGVYAAKAPGLHLTAQRAGADDWHLDGTKPWCSLAERLSHALITADDDGRGRLFAVRLDDSVQVRAATWAPRGLTEIRTVTLDLDATPAVPIGEPGWYLSRPGFWWGAIGVAAVWFGGAAAVAGRLLAAAHEREPDDFTLAAIGRVDTTLHAALLALRHAAEAIDANDPGMPLLATRVRARVAATVDEVLHTVGHTLGPGPLAHDATHAKRVADLTLYVRQHHGERDLAALGRLVIDG